MPKGTKSLCELGYARVLRFLIVPTPQNEEGTFVKIPGINDPVKAEKSHILAKLNTKTCLDALDRGEFKDSWQGQMAA